MPKRNFELSKPKSTNLYPDYAAVNRPALDNPKMHMRVKQKKVGPLEIRKEKRAISTSHRSSPSQAASNSSHNPPHRSSSASQAQAPLTIYLLPSVLVVTEMLHDPPKGGSKFVHPITHVSQIRGLFHHA